MSSSARSLALVIGLAAIGLAGWALTRIAGRDQASAPQLTARTRSGDRPVQPPRPPPPPTKGIARAPIVADAPRAPARPPVDAAPPAGLADTRDQLVALTERIEAMADRGEHLDQTAWDELYAEGNRLGQTLLRSPAVREREVFREIDGLGVRFRAAAVRVRPPAPPAPAPRP